jgi:xanthine dehydrogenase accessory factor
MNKLSWTQAINHCQQAGTGYVIATVIGAQGSTPRDANCKMVIDPEHCYDTIGGGQLEYLITQEARTLLTKNKTAQVFKPMPLGAEAAQCCGGFVTVMLECFAASEQQVVLFGAGHVSQALQQILGGLACRVTLIDNRPEQIPRTLPANCKSLCVDDPASVIDTLPDNSYLVIFTHDHQLDYSISKQALCLNRFAFVGLIGSDTKAKRFKKRLASESLSQSLIDTLNCPIGLPELSGKLPMEVALSIAAQLQSLFAKADQSLAPQATTWRQIKQAIRSAEQTSPLVSISE